MEVEQIHLADLFQYDEIYWVPADLQFVGIRGVESSLGEKIANNEMKIKILQKPNDASQMASKVFLSDNHSFESESSLDGESSKSTGRISTPWVVVGSISEIEKSRLSLIFSAPPLLLSEKNWSIYEPTDEEPILSEFITCSGAQKFIFVGQQPAVWQSDFQVTELVQIEGKSVYFFPRLLSTLTDAEKSLKLVFWNALKSML